MDVQSLLQRLGELDVRLWVEGGQLRFSAPKGVLQGALRDALVAAKAEVVAHLSAPQVLPASANQEMLWSLDRLEPDCPQLYIEARAVRLTGPLNLPALTAALNALCGRHDSLRTRLEMADDGLHQVVVPDITVTIPVEDATGLDGTALEARVNAVAWAPFDLGTAPLLRLTWLRTGADAGILVFAQHHIVTDRWSIALLVRELSALYAALQAGRPAPLPPAPAQYSDYTRWQRQRLAERGDALMAYWRQTLEGAPPLLNLPTDRSYPKRASHRGGRIERRLDRTFTGTLDGFCRREGVTPFMAVTAAYAALLHRLSGQDTVVVGTPIANRLRADFEGVAGYCVNTLALRLDVDGAAPFRDLLAWTRDMALTAYEHQELPFSQLVAALQPDRGASHPPLFQVMIALQNIEMAELAFGDAALTPYPLAADTGKYPLMLTMLPDEAGGPLLCWDYQTDLFDAGTVADIAQRFELLLADALAAPERPVGRLALLTPADLARLRGATNRDALVPRPALESVPTLFRAQAAASPGATALVHGAERIDYRTLDRRSDLLAGYLARAGVRAGDTVGIALDRSPDFITGALAILKCGAAYVPLDRRYPAERLAWMAADSGIRLLLTAADADTPWTDARRLIVDMADLDLEEEPVPVPPGVTADSPAYIMYTSGSTGRPKGVVVPHRGINRLVKDADFARLDADQVMLMLAPVSFDASTLEIWGALLNGGTLVIAPPLEDDLLALGRVIRESGVTTLWVTAGLFTLLVENGLDDLRGVRQLLTGGDFMPRRAAADVLARLPDTTLINGYGPTENTTFTTCHAFGPGPLGDVVPVGRAISGTTVYIVDAHGNPVPPGVAGELLTGGEGLALGYHNRPDLTAERFVTQEFAFDGLRWSERLYRTGDLARWVPDPAGGDGLVVDLLGRVDAQVKIRGFRVEPGEVEAALGALPGIADCAVVARRDDGQARLVAYYVAREGATLADPRAALARQLPDHLVPAQIVALPALPVTPNGKVDRQALAGARYKVVGGGTDGAEAPATAIEILLARIWADVLAGGPYSRASHFFDQGGNSLSAIRMVTRARDALAAAGQPQALPVRAVFEHPTLAALAAAIDAGDKAVAAADAPRPCGLGRTNLPLSYAQERLWVLEKMLPLGGAYNVPGQYRLDGPLNVAALARAIETVIARHDVLSAVFVEQDGRAVQRIAATGTMLDVRDAGETQVAGLLAAGAEAPFDLERGPPVRATLLRIGPDRHILQMVMHHLVCDGWSLTAFLREVETLYAGGALAPLPLQYQDYANWHRGWLQGPLPARALDYWRAKLADLPPSLELPTDFPRPAVPSNRGATETLPLDLDTAAVDTLCRQHSVTRFMLFYAAFTAFLYRVTGETDFGVGTPIAGRHHAAVEPLVGFFADNLVLRTPVDDGVAFSTLLAQARTTVLEAFEHQDVPFTTLVEALRPERRLDTTPLFQVMLAVEEDTAFPLRLDGVTATPLAWESPYAKYDLTLSIRTTDSGLMASLEYNTDLFHPISAGRLGRQFATLMAELLADPAQAVDAIDVRPAAERAGLPGLAGTARPRPVGVGLHGLATARPGAPALVYDDTVLTHAQVQAAANRLAHHLIARGLRPGDLVGVHRRRALDLPVLLLGILKAGGGYVPLNPNHPADRLAAILRTATPALILTGPDFPVSDTDCVLVDPDAEAAAIAARSDTDPAVPVDDERSAYVMFTSGSTGVPKGVAVPHRAAVNHQLWFGDVVGLTADDTLLQMTSFDFDASVIEFFAPLTCGGHLVMAPPEAEKDPAALGALIRAHGVTVFQAVPALLQIMADEGILATCPSLRLVCSGGEVLATELQDRLLAQLGAARLLNCYGPTESGIDATWHECAPGAEPRPASVPIGRPVHNMRAYVLDHARRPVAAGLVGDLYLAGMSLATGYLNAPALTEAAFLADPVAGGIMYRTGDRVRVGPDDTLVFLGRADSQVKVRGYRIETAEVEAALNALPAVRESAVIGLKRPGDTEHRLVAFIVGTADEAALRAGLRRTLPDYMVPAHFLVLDALPLVTSGKVDRRRLANLAEPALRDATTTTDRVAPRNGTEQRLAAIWANVLGGDTFGVHDNFFERGGHSLKAVQVVARIRDQWPGMDLSVRHVFEAPTIAGLATLLRPGGAGDGDRPALLPQPRIPGPDGTALMPISYAQRALWFLDRLEEGGRAYTTVDAFVLAGRLDLGALRAALDALVRRHESLRTCFILREGEPCQHILPPLPMPFIHKTTAATADLESLALAEGAQPIDLSREPPLRVSVITLTPDRHLAVLTWHHIATDGWSTGVLVREIGALYTAALAGESLDGALPPLPLQYGDYADWQQRWLASAGFKRQLDYWVEQLAEAPTHLNLCTDRPRPQRQSFRGATLRFTVAADLVRGLASVGQAAGASPFMTLLAVFMVLLHRQSRQEDVLVGTPVANRPASELEGLLGFFTNTLVLRGRLEGNPRFSDFLAQMRRTALDAYANADVPFEKLVDALDPPRSLAHSPLFQAMFNLQNTPRAPLALPGLDLVPVEIDTRTAKFDLLLTLIEAADGGLDGHWEYSTDLFDPATAQRMVDQYLSLLHAVVANADLPLRDMALATPDDTARLLAACQGPAMPNAGNGRLHLLFEATAATQPDRVAVTFNGTDLSYAQLDRRANALAHRLVTLGVRPDTPVGIRLERSLDMVVAMLGILKAGGAYVPLDPALPHARLDYIIGNAGLALVVGSAPEGGLPRGAEAVAVTEEEKTVGPPVANLTPEHLAYVLYTSGSTGQPKGVLMPHRALVNLIRWQVAEPSFAHGLRTLQFTTLGFDVACQEMFACWASAGTLVLMADALRRDVPAMIAQAATWGIQRIFLPFTALQQLAEAWPLATRRPQGLLELITAGERLKVTPSLRALFRDLPDCRLVNQYGPTETHVATALVLPADPDRWPELPRIGRPVANTAVYILDEDGHPLPVGVPGQLWIAGSAVSRGYLGRLDLTEQSFRPNPYGPGMMYATGDLACIRWDGAAPELDFLGRIDAQVKIRGYRIEPEEVERALIAQGRVRDAAVVAWTDGSGEKRLVAYYVPADAAAGDSRVVRDGLAAQVPDYMVPTLWVPLPALPQTRTGKVDRKALPAPDRTGAAPAARITPPRSATEQAVAAIWQSVLQVPQVGLHDNFFDLGGYSFLLLRVLAEVRRQFPAARQVTMVSLFEHPTVQALAHLIDGAQAVALRHRAAQREAQAPLRQDLNQRRTAQRHATSSIAPEEIPS
ncbi:amino acid adenylation domain-containing protein [Niveispirillum sp. SYP-B3756]|uniref:non-ribosomal peptide synthetase n=1 Tax=Niveispirillum sp. SYP-B3756 TaxID=2662178 RepID=UPI0012908C59|nr:amino acid adenylation domain-containing protein [Niveispirillum sp. SYP-B3756]